MIITNKYNPRFRSLILPGSPSSAAILTHLLNNHNTKDFTPMTEDKINLRGFRKNELLTSLERLFLGYYCSPLDEGEGLEQKNELVMNYLAIKQIIESSEAG